MNDPIAILLEDGEDESALDGFDAGGGGGSTTKSETPKEPDQPAADETEAGSEGQDTSKSGGKSSEPDQGGDVPPAPKDDDGNRIFASPLARRLAQQQESISPRSAARVRMAVSSRQISKAMPVRRRASRPKRSRVRHLRLLRSRPPMAMRNTNWSSRPTCARSSPSA